MADNFTAEATNSAGQLFATDQEATSSVHYPIGKIAWGALNTFNVTDSSNPFPVRLWGNNSAAPVHITTDSGAPPTVTVSNSPDSTVTAAITGNASVVNSSTAPLFVRGVGDSTLPVSGTVTANIAGNASVTITAITTTTGGGAIDSINSAIRVNIVAGGDANDTTVTASITGNASVVNSSTAPLFVDGTDSVNGLLVNLGSNNDVTISGNASVTITGGQSSVSISAGSSVSVTGSSTTEIGMALNAIAGNSGGALQTFTSVLSSAIESATSSAARLYGYYMFNPSTAATVYVKVFDDDSAGVTKGTTAASINIALPPEGGANVSFPQGILMSSGISLLAAGGTGLTDTSAPSTSAVVNLFFAG